jgi:hypothetical protein
VLSLSGPSAGTTWNARTVPASLAPIGATATTSSNAASSWPTRTCSPTSSSSETASGRSATTSSGPLTPAPNFSAVMEYAWYCVDSSGSAEPVGRPRRIDSAGIAMISRTARPPTSVSTAREVRIGVVGTASGSSWPTVARFFFGSTFRPIRDSRAGVSVMAMRTAMRMQNAPTDPMRPRNGMPVTLSASSATNTVAPANTTALPAVPLARPIDSSSSTPSRSWRRCRLRMNSE